MKFGAENPEFVLVKTRWGFRHAIKAHNGALNHCRGNPATCKFCHEYGVPVEAPDPISAMMDALRANWGKRWAESNRHPHAVAENEIWQGKGLHIVAREDDDPANRTVLVSFGDDPTIAAAVGALVHVHNEMIGKPD
ncbi:hypothetical protein [Sphingobium chungbukense]|uniref:Uncharacterized protein n=1 Tax=Sphingobium chungbukense TaxID=56193 RepID=A0A0M3AVN4_9SPHN|nr:hypothetical protein [Sphingobium chungbukense]KKW93895.1 hypothetical protein YP76_04395 [Sphingobium chungbukense]